MKQVDDHISTATTDIKKDVDQQADKNSKGIIDKVRTIGYPRAIMLHVATCRKSMDVAWSCAVSGFLINP